MVVKSLVQCQRKRSNELTIAQKANNIPETTNMPSGLKEASKVASPETGLTLYVDSCNDGKRISDNMAPWGGINLCKSFPNSQVCHEMNQEHEYAHQQLSEA